VNQPSFPQTFKGIAIFTPGGDSIYCIDPNKQDRWHLHLCTGLQEILGLPEPPHFLVPGYTATIDRWLEPQTQQVKTSAELYRPVRQHQALLNAMFGTDDLDWQVAPWQEGSCDPVVLETYRDRFPQLWEEHDLIVRFDRSKELSALYPAGRSIFQATEERLTNRPSPPDQSHACEETSRDVRAQRAQGYVLRLFVSENSEVTEQTLKSLHQLLENTLRYPYTLKVINVFKHPEQAEINQISATPTLLRVWPTPARRIVGNLSDVQQVLRILAAPEA
jgi:circadian clock protein KaiB